MLLDTNIIIYSTKPEGHMLTAWTVHPNAAVASVTWVEALGFKGLPANEERAIRELLSQVMTYPLDEEIIERAIHLRQQQTVSQQQTVKLGDAIIAATALEYGVPLVTRNERDFRRIAGLQIINPFAAGTA